MSAPLRRQETEIAIPVPAPRESKMVAVGLKQGGWAAGIGPKLRSQP